MVVFEGNAAIVCRVVRALNEEIMQSGTQEPRRRINAFFFFLSSRFSVCF